jgi:y4mF family transcriptional regulator
MRDSPDFSKIVRFHRKRAGLTQAGLASLAGVGKTVVFDIENGKETVRLSTLAKVMGALNIALDWSSPLREAFEEAAAEGAGTRGAEDDR